MGLTRYQKKAPHRALLKVSFNLLIIISPPPPACATGAVVARARWSILDKDTINIKAITPISTSFDITTPL